VLTLVHVPTAVLVARAHAVFAALTRYAAVGEVVLVSSGWQGAHGILAAGRALAGRRLEALLVDAEVTSPERRLIQQMLGEGVVPVVFTRADLAGTLLANWVWLNPDRVVVLPRDLPAGGPDRSA
jgi:hypothetical protein